MRTSDTLAKLAPDLAKAQTEIESAKFNQTGHHGKYADLASVREASAPILAKHGLSIVQTYDRDETGPVLLTRLLHSSGEWMEACYPLPEARDKPQVFGSATTYGRRYSWAAMCGLAAEEDDEGERAQTHLTGQRNHGPAEPVPGKLGKTKLQAALRRFNDDLAACSDEETFVALMNGEVPVSGERYNVGEILTQCQADLPSWYWTREGSDALGIKDRIDAKREEVTKPEEFPGVNADDPASYQE